MKNDPQGSFFVKYKQFLGKTLTILLKCAIVDIMFFLYV
jgi:hypothetical protein